jgi:ribosome-associated protein
MDQTIEISTTEGSDYIQLCDLLKHAGLSDSGGAAKYAIALGAVTVDGVVETRKRRKVRPGQVVEYEGRKVTVVGA